MLHLIWVKDSNDLEEPRSIRNHVVQSYSRLYFEDDKRLDHGQNVGRVVQNLIKLTRGALMARLISMEQLLSVMMSNNMISNDVVKRLWSIYGKRRLLAGCSIKQKYSHLSQNPQSKVLHMIKSALLLCLECSQKQILML